MKKILIALLLTSSAFLTSPKTMAAAPALVWAGLDYSKTKMIGTMDFRQPDQIFPGMLITWNELFIREMVPKLQQMAKSTPVEVDIDAVEAMDQKASSNQVLRQDGTHSQMVDQNDISSDDISKMVSGYKLKRSDGLGLVFIVDRLVKAQEVGCVYAVFFDVASRRVLSSERVIGKAGGFGFRNFWFHPIKDTVAKLPKMYKPLK